MVAREVARGCRQGASCAVDEGRLLERERNRRWFDGRSDNRVAQGVVAVDKPESIFPDECVVATLVHYLLAMGAQQVLSVVDAHFPRAGALVDGQWEIVFASLREKFVPSLTSLNDFEGSLHFFDESDENTVVRVLAFEVQDASCFSLEYERLQDKVDKKHARGISLLGTLEAADNGSRA